MSSVVDNMPRAPPVKYKAPLGTRWEKEKAAAGAGAFDYPDDAKFVGPWIIGECVGKGASGHVKIAKHRRTGQLAAVKILPLQPFVTSRPSQTSQAKTEKQRLGIDREITMMKLMNHPNIMRIYDVYEGETELYLILEYVEGGELFDFLVNRGRLAPLEALGYFKQIVYGLNYAHTFSIIHRDLKPENILIHSLEPPLVKIADWGMAAFAPPTLQLETSCGSPHYASPEIVNGHRYTGTATDIWSCGVILYALLTGRLPFDDKNVRTLLGKVKTGRYEMPAYIDPLARDLLSRMLVVDVRKRITVGIMLSSFTTSLNTVQMAEILVHPWLDGYTPGITYVPAPPVSELAKPLQSAHHIDRDLFQSLCVIWGRHADPDSIRVDLLSPEGEGTLAKAFYFLLQKHRERTMEEHGILMDDILKSPGKVVIKQYSTPRSRIRPVQPDISTKLPLLPVRASRGALAPARSTTSNPPALQISTKPILERPSTREHPPSPIGPRPQRPRPMSSPVGDGRVGGSYQRAEDTRQEIRSSARPMSADATDSPRAFHVSEMLASLPRQVQSPHGYRRSATLASATARASSGLSHNSAGQNSRAPETFTSPPFLHAPAPVLASQPKILPMITAPRVQDAELQKTFDQYANMVNAQAHTWNTTRAHLSSTHMGQTAYPLEFDRPRRPMVELDIENTPSSVDSRRTEDKAADKENVDQGQVAKKDTNTQSSTTTGGLGFGSSVPMVIPAMGKEMTNVMHINPAEKRDKKHRCMCFARYFAGQIDY